jgi:hypothetical protein
MMVRMKRPEKTCSRCGLRSRALHFRFAAGHAENPTPSADYWACGPGTVCFEENASDLERRIAAAAA